MKKNITPLPIPWIEENEALPHAKNALNAESPLAGLVAAGGGLSVTRLIEAYSNGMFPWYSEGQPVLWWSPNPRMVLPIDEFKLHRSLRKTLIKFLKNPNCEVKFDSEFDEVIQNCSIAMRPGQNGTWIVEDMIEAYQALHQEGLAHSVETWIDGELVGGLYCVSIGRTIFGESMFSKRSDASKISLAALIAFAKANNVKMIDCQQNTKHLASVGAREISRDEFLSIVNVQKNIPSMNWQYSVEHWHSLLASPASQ